MSHFQNSVVFKNNSGIPASAALFQTGPNSNTSLVWLSRYTYPATSVTFQWFQNYGICWSQTGGSLYSRVSRLRVPSGLR